MPRIKVTSQEQGIVEKARQLEKLIAKRDKVKVELNILDAEIESATTEMQALLPARAAAPARDAGDSQPGVSPLFAGGKLEQGPTALQQKAANA